MNKPKVIAILGPTASGKTSLAVELALAMSGEVISADSRQVYSGLAIGSGQITKDEACGVPHHLISIVDPRGLYTGADFVRDANAAILDITKRGKVPIIAGGTFFYVDLLRGKQSAAPVPINPELQAELEKLSTEELVRRLTEKDSRRASEIDIHNRRRLIRALEIIDAIGEVPNITESPSPYDWLIFGIDIDRSILNKRIEERMHARLALGLEDEVQKLLESDVPKKRLLDFGLEYRYLASHDYKELSQDQIVSALLPKLRQFAKRQQTWLRRDEEIIWKKFPLNTKEIIAEAKTFINKATTN